MSEYVPLEEFSVNAGVPYLTRVVGLSKYQARVVRRDATYFLKEPRVSLGVLWNEIREILRGRTYEKE